jgi:hypothetical protein
MREANPPRLHRNRPETATPLLLYPRADCLGEPAEPQVCEGAPAEAGNRAATEMAPGAGSVAVVSGFLCQLKQAVPAGGF